MLGIQDRHQPDRCPLSHHGDRDQVTIGTTIQGDGALGALALCSIGARTPENNVTMPTATAITTTSEDATHFGLSCPRFSAWSPRQPKKKLHCTATTPALAKQSGEVLMSFIRKARRGTIAAAVTLGPAPALPAPAAAETLIRIQSVIPTSADEVVMLEDFAADVTALTNGEVRFEVLPAGAVVGVNETLDAVDAGLIEAGFA